MGVFDVFKRKKKEDLEFPSEPEELPQEGPGQVLPEERFPSIQPTTGINERDMQLILAKLELIKQKLDSMEERIRLIEKIAKESQ